MGEELGAVDPVDQVGRSALRAARQAQGLTLRELGERSGVSAATLSQLETGKTALSPQRARSLAVVLGVEPQRLHPGLDGTGDPDIGSGGPLRWREFPPLALDAALRGAFECFVEKGFHGAPVRDIALASGLSIPTLYLHYASKQAMLAALLDLGITELLSRTRAARDEGRDTREQFCLMVEALALYHAHRAELSFLGTSELRALSMDDRRRHTGLRMEQQHMVDDAVRAGVDEGVFSTQEPRAASRAVVSMCLGIAGWYRPGGAATPVLIAARYVDFSLDVVRGRMSSGKVACP